MRRSRTAAARSETGTAPARTSETGPAEARQARAAKAEKAYKIAVSEYNADMFVQRINGLVEFLINEKKL